MAKPVLNGKWVGGKLVLTKPDMVSEEEWAELGPILARGLARAGARSEAKRAARKKKARKASMAPEVKAHVRRLDRDNPWGMRRRWKQWWRRNLEAFRARMRRDEKRRRSLRQALCKTG